MMQNELRSPIISYMLAWKCNESLLLGILMLEPVYCPVVIENVEIVEVALFRNKCTLVLVSLFAKVDDAMLLIVTAFTW